MRSTNTGRTQLSAQQGKVNRRDGHLAPAPPNCCQTRVRAVADPSRSGEGGLQGGDPGVRFQQTGAGRKNVPFGVQTHAAL